MLIVFNVFIILFVCRRHQVGCILTAWSGLSSFYWGEGGAHLLYDGDGTDKLIHCLREVAVNSKGVLHVCCLGIALFPHQCSLCVRMCGGGGACVWYCGLIYLTLICTLVHMTEMRKGFVSFTT